MDEMLRAVRDFLLGEPLPEDDHSMTSEWVQLAEWSTTEQAVVISLVLMVLVVSAWNLRRVRGVWRRVGLSILRLMIVVVLLFAFYQPALLEERRARSNNTIIVLADDSASMSLPYEEGTRRDLLASFVRSQQDLLERLEETNTIDSYRFTDTLEGADWRDLERELRARGDNTAVAEVLESLRKRYRNRDIGGVLLLSDGIDNGRAGRLLEGGNELDRETIRLLQSFEAPFYTFGIDRSEIRDISVHELRYSPFAFKRNLSTIEAELRVHGYDSGTLEVELLEEGRLVRSVTTEIQPGVSSYSASFDFTPLALGHRVYTVRVRPFPDEITAENNERYAVIRVNRDKIRVLQIAGNPSWDVRFLRNHLKRTPNIQLISFFILINSSGMLRRVTSGETALIPFPAEDLFVRELGSFDVVILQDFEYGPFKTRQHLHRIRDYVKGGGALLAVGGQKALAAGKFGGTELTEVLPVDLNLPDPDPAESTDTREYSAVLTEAGRSHTITRLSFDPTTNEHLWESMPPLEGINLSLDLDNGGIALVGHPKIKTAGGDPMPVIAVGEPGEGRCMVVATDSLWRLKMPWVGGGGDPSHYDRLWNNAIRWLIGDPELDLLRVTPSAGVRSIGEPVSLEVRVFQPDYRPAADHDFSLRIVRREDASRPGEGEVVDETSGLRTDDKGRWSVTRALKQPGIYDVRVRAVVAGRQLTATTVFVVSDERREMRRILADDGLLEAIADATGGAAGTLTDRNPRLRFNPPRVSDVTSRRYHERWNVPGVFLLACLLFGLEWWLRRRAGLL